MCREIQLYLRAMDLLGRGAPFAAALTLVGVKGAVIGLAPFAGTQVSDRRIRRLEEDPLVLPETLVFEPSVLPQEFMRPVFDAMWQAGGYARCYEYDDEGIWRGNNRI